MPKLASSAARTTAPSTAVPEKRPECAALTAPGTTRTQQRDEGTGWPSTETTSR